MDKFEQLIIKCCELSEKDLRFFIKELCKEHGFTIKEDNYKSQRGEEYKTVHNLLLMRGNKPQICLVAHTDVCRDHGNRYKDVKVKPVIKNKKEIDDTITRIIQDETCSVQTGGDDRLGVAINLWTAINNDFDMGLLFTTDEEIGVISAANCEFPELGDFEILVQVDRGNHSNQLVKSISGVRLCSNEVKNELLKLAKDMKMPRYPVDGLLTDVFAIVSNDRCKNAINLTCGYFNSFGSSVDEYINIEDARDTMKYVTGIINHYNSKTIEKKSSCDFTLDQLG